MQNTNTTDNTLNRLHPSLRATFVALPGDPAVPLTDEQLALFIGERRAFVRDILTLAARGAQRVSAEYENG